jgi:transcriptional regulator with XRE-family HTH domain
MTGSDAAPNDDDPGDLGKRVHARRVELGLRLDQVAEAVGMSPDYLEHLERDPGVQVRAQSLSRLAGELQTTVAALLGAGMTRPPGAARGAGGHVVDLDEAERWQRLSPGGVGRVVFDDERGPTALPVNYRMWGRNIVFRTVSSSAFAALHDAEPVGFEVDHIDDALDIGWSVLATGHARVPADEAELEEVQALDIVPWAGGERSCYLIFEPSELTGREIVHD